MIDEITVKSIVDRLAAVSDPRVMVTVEENCPLNRRIGGKYNPTKHAVTIYTSEIQEQCKLLYPGESVFLPFLTVVLAHELGHATDLSLPKLSRLHDLESDSFQKRKIELLIEVQAWKIARKLVPEIPSSFFNKIKRHSLRGYYDAINEYYEQVNIA